MAISQDFWIERGLYMRVISFGTTEVGVTDFDDITADERVLEFRLQGTALEQDAFAAIAIPYGGGWDDALLSINPQVGEVSAPLMREIIEFAKGIIEESC